MIMMIVNRYMRMLIPSMKILILFEASIMMMIIGDIMTLMIFVTSMVMFQPDLGRSLLRLIRPS